MVSSDTSLATIALWIAAAMLLVAIPPIWPYGYYVLLRLVVTAVAIFTIIVSYETKRWATMPLAGVALLFNPFIPVHLPKEAWVPIDLVVAGFFALVGFQLRGAKEFK